MADFAAARRAGSGDGWVLRRASEPLILAGAMLPAIFVAMRANQRVSLVLAPGSSADLTCLARAAARSALIALRVALNESLAERQQQRAPGLLVLHYTARGDMAQLPALLSQAIGETEQRGAAQRLEAVFEDACDAGVLTEQQLAERLACPSEELPAVLAQPEPTRLAKTYSMHYVEGFGLCATQVLMRARSAAREVVSHPEWAESTLQTMLRLSRRLREVTGASEGIECLIAYLGAA